MNLELKLTVEEGEIIGNENEDDISQECPQDSMSQVMENIVIVENIAKFLSVPDILKARSLNKLWKLGSMKTLRKKSVVILKMGGSRSKSKLEYFPQETKDLAPLRSCKIEMSTNSPHPSFSTPEKDYGSVCEAELEAFNDILQHLSPCLEILEIGQERLILNHPYRPPFAPRDSLKFPKLCKLIISHRHNLNRSHAWQLDKRIYQKMYPSLFASAPKLKELRFERLDILIGIVLDPLVHPENKSRNWTLAPKLTALADLGLGYREGYRYLTKFPQTFTRLDLAHIRPELFPEFGAFLAKNKNSLVSLKLWEFTGESENSTISGSEQLKMPGYFPNLQQLEFAFRDLEFDFKFESGKLNYAKNFPALKKLSIDFIGVLHPKQGEKLKNIFDTFFPEQVFETLEVLETDFEALEKVAKDSLWYLKLFPNAKIKELKFAGSFYELIQSDVDISKIFPQRQFND